MRRATLAISHQLSFFVEGMQVTCTPDLAASALRFLTGLERTKLSRYLVKLPTWPARLELSVLKSQPSLEDCSSEVQHASLIKRSSIFGLWTMENYSMFSINLSMPLDSSLLLRPHETVNA